eukprot:631131-Karenia_brevis.AAC.1
MNIDNHAAKDNTTTTTTERSLRPTLIHNETIEVETARMCMKEMQSHATLSGICWWRKRSKDKTSEARSEIPRARYIARRRREGMIVRDREKELTAWPNMKPKHN